MELYLKGLIIERTGSKLYIHLLTELLSIILELEGKETSEEVMRCAASFEAHYLRARYPESKLKDYTEKEAEGTVRCMKVILSFIQSVEDSYEEPKIKEEASREFIGRWSRSALILFGSRARGEANPRADLKEGVSGGLARHIATEIRARGPYDVLPYF